MQCNQCGTELNTDAQSCHVCGNTMDTVPEDVLNSVDLVRNEVLSDDAPARFSFIGNNSGEKGIRRYFASRMVLLWVTCASMIIAGVIIAGIYWYTHPRQKPLASVNVTNTNDEKPAHSLNISKQGRTKEKNLPAHRSKKRKKAERVIEVSRKNYVPPSMPTAEIIEGNKARIQDRSESLIEKILNRPTTRDIPSSRDPRETGL
ncbi:MAG: hypothetical protein ABFD12_02065 [Syntrophorhabdus sp.]